MKMKQKKEKVWKVIKGFENGPIVGTDYATCSFSGNNILYSGH